MSTREEAPVTEPTPELLAAYRFVEEIVNRADGNEHGPFWHGWALREAFLAGVAFERKSLVDALPEGYSLNHEDDGRWTVTGPLMPHPMMGHADTPFHTARCETPEDALGQAREGVAYA